MKRANEKSINKAKLLPAIIAFAIMLFSICGCSSTKTTDSDNTATIEPTETQVIEQTETPTSNADGSYESGTYKVGTDLPAGEYVIVSDGYCYMEVSKDNTDSIDSIIWNDSFYNRSIVTLENGQYFEVSGGTIYPFSTAPEVSKTGGELSEGMYKVGVDLPAGQYKVCVDSDCGFIQVSRDSSHTDSSIISNEDLDKDKYVTVSKGQYLTVSGGHIILNN